MKIAINNKTEVRLLIISFLVLFAIFSILAPNTVINGDSAAYNKFIKNANFSSIAVHWGYYVIGFIFFNILPFSVDKSTNIMAAMSGAGLVITIYIFVKKVFNNQTVALTSSIILLGSYGFILSSLISEVYIVSTFLFLISLIFWLEEKPYLSAPFALSSVLVSPMIGAIAPLYFIKFNLKKVIIHSIIFIIGLLVFIAVYWKDLFFGGRGLFNLTSIGGTIPITKSLINHLLFSVLNFWIVSPLLIIGIIVIIKNKKYHQYGIICSICIILTIILIRYVEVISQLQIFLILAIIGGIGTDYFLNTNKILDLNIRKGIILTILLISIIFSVFLALNYVSYSKDIRVDFLTIGSEANSQDIFIGSFNSKIFYDYYNTGSLSTNNSFYNEGLYLLNIEGNTSYESKLITFNQVESKLLGRSKIILLDSQTKDIFTLEPRFAISKVNEKNCTRNSFSKVMKCYDGPWRVDLI